MQRDRIALTVLVDLDSLPGTFHTPESARRGVEAVLLSRIGHYNPVVLIDQPKQPE